MRPGTILILIGLGIVLSACSEDYRPANPLTGGSVTTTYAPNGSKVFVIHTPEGGQRQMMVNKEGRIVSDENFDPAPAPPVQMRTVRSPRSTYRREQFNAHDRLPVERRGQPTQGWMPTVDCAAVGGVRTTNPNTGSPSCFVP